jgi:hypothetical protein
MTAKRRFVRAARGVFAPTAHASREGGALTTCSPAIGASWPALSGRPLAQATPWSSAGTRHTDPDRGDEVAHVGCMLARRRRGSTSSNLRRFTLRFRGPRRTSELAPGRLVVGPGGDQNARVSWMVTRREVWSALRAIPMRPTGHLHATTDSHGAGVWPRPKSPRSPTAPRPSRRDAQRHREPP